MTTTFPVSQLTYGILPAGEGRSGGWQVVQVSRGADRHDVALMLREVCTVLDPVTATPRFPTPEQILARPRRLVFRGFLEAGVWSHAVPAGTDPTGRSGNVFTHVMLAARWGLGNELPDVSRPVEWCTAPWLVPFGPAEVGEAIFSEDDPPTPPDPWSLRVDMLKRLFGPELHDRELVIAAWLDAVAWAMSEGVPLSGLPGRESSRCVVLGLDDLSSAPWWLAVASYLTEAQLCRRISFSTFDRLPHLLGEPSPPRLTVRVVPREDLEAWQGRVPADVVLFDVLDPPAPVGDRWVCAGQVEFEKTRWGFSLQRLLDGGLEAATEALVRLDHASLEQPSFSPSHPGLALELLLQSSAGPGRGHRGWGPLPWQPDAPEPSPPTGNDADPVNEQPATDEFMTDEPVTDEPVAFDPAAADPKGR